MDTVSIIAPAMAFPINIPRSDSTTLILKIDAKAAPDHEPVVGRGTPTKTTKPIILAAFSFLAPVSYTHLDVYKRQLLTLIIWLLLNLTLPLSFYFVVHLDTLDFVA